MASSRYLLKPDNFDVTFVPEVTAADLELHGFKYDSSGWSFFHDYISL